MLQGFINGLRFKSVQICGLICFSAALTAGCAASPSDATVDANQAAATDKDANSLNPDASATDGSAQSLPIAADRKILDWTGDEAIILNEAKLPKGFSAIDQTACAKNPDHQYIGEIFQGGTKNIQVFWHWAPVVSGPNVAKRTMNQPEFSMAGELESASDGDDDVLADHPFGPDHNADVLLDHAYRMLAGDFAEDGKPGQPDALHAEIEERIIPRQDLGYFPKVGDRTIMRGAWILDCGHPPYGTEMHPPTFVAYARKLNEKTSDFMTVVLPYRSSLLFNPDPKLAADFANDARFSLEDTQPFEYALMGAVLAAVSGQVNVLTAHALMIANHIEPADWLVCAPLPRPEGAALDATWRFTLRTGVTLQATPDEKSGCVRFVAAMTPDYKPLALPYVDAAWDWNKLSKSASGQANQSVDVRKQIKKIVESLGLSSDVTALQPDNPPRVDAYPQLKTRPAADQFAPTAIVEHADDQPFPLYGRAHVGWK